MVGKSIIHSLNTVYSVKEKIMKFFSKKLGGLSSTCWNYYTNERQMGCAYA